MMSDGSLSQAEIDALLDDASTAGVADAAATDVTSPVATSSPLPAFTPSSAPSGASDVVAVRRLATQALPQEEVIIKGLINTKCSLKLLNSEPLDLPALIEALGAQSVQIMRTISGASGTISYLLAEPEAITFASYTIGQDDLVINDLVLNALREIFAQLHEPLLQLIGDERGVPLDVADTTAAQVVPTALTIPATLPILNTYQLAIKKEKIVFYEIVDGALISSAPAPETVISTEPASISTPQSAPEPAYAPAPAAPPASVPTPDFGMQQIAQTSPEVKPIMLSDFGNQQSSIHQTNIELLMDVEMKLSVELGQTRKQVRDILQLGEGSIIELDKLAGEPIDIKVNQQLIAKGEVVVIDENFGVRITEIISPSDRLRQMG